MSNPANAAATPRTIPWDCSDWQASAAVDDAEDARVSVILESLATNRGKTLYCAVDQSDTFTKTETWEAGKDRNERDDTVYYGANGRFRGFLAAQEGYLTDGESGVTGISRDRIFEFPEEPSRRVKRIKRRTISGVVGSPFGQPYSGQYAVANSARIAAHRRVTGDIGAKICGDGAGNTIGNGCTDEQMDGWAAPLAAAECTAQGYPRVTNIRVAARSTETWDYRRDRTITNYRYQARRIRNYTATCTKTVRVRRR